jgi:hypothetical protein
MRRNASISVERLEGRALLAQAPVVPGLGQLTNPTPIMMNPQPIGPLTNPTLTMLNVTPVTTSSAVSMGTQTATQTTGMRTGTASIVISPGIGATGARLFSMQSVRSGFTAPMVTPASRFPTNLRLSASSSRSTMVVNPAAPATAPAPAIPAAPHGLQGQHHHRPAGSGGHHGHHRK